MRDFIAGDADQSLETAAKAILSRSFREVTKHWPQDIYTGQRLFEGYLERVSVPRRGDCGTSFPAVNGDNAARTWVDNEDIVACHCKATAPVVWRKLCHVPSSPSD